MFGLSQTLFSFAVLKPGTTRKQQMLRACFGQFSAASWDGVRAAMTKRAAETGLEFFSAWFCPYAQRAWIALEHHGMKYRKVEGLIPDAPGDDFKGYKKHPRLLELKLERFRATVSFFFFCWVSTLLFSQQILWDLSAQSQESERLGADPLRRWDATGLRKCGVRGIHRWARWRWTFRQLDARFTSREGRLEIEGWLDQQDPWKKLSRRKIWVQWWLYLIVSIFEGFEPSLKMLPCLTSSVFSSGTCARRFTKCWCAPAPTTVRQPSRCWTAALINWRQGTKAMPQPSSADSWDFSARLGYSRQLGLTFWESNWRPLTLHSFPGPIEFFAARFWNASEAATWLSAFGPVITVLCRLLMEAIMNTLVWSWRVSTYSTWALLS